MTRTMPDNPVPNIIFVPGEVACINLSKAAGEITSDLQKISLSPFLSIELSKAVTDLHDAIENTYTHIDYIF